jgi:hypothetical protein
MLKPKCYQRDSEARRSRRGLGRSNPRGKTLWGMYWMHRVFVCDDDEYYVRRKLLTLLERDKSTLTPPRMLAHTHHLP